MDIPHIYCLNYNNPVRRTSMEARFKQVGINRFTMSKGVSINDSRISASDNQNILKCHSCMFGHLDMIRDFLYNSADSYAIFCEDDILIDVGFTSKITHIMKDFSNQNLDILLLGYLIPHVIEGTQYHNNNAYISGAYKYYDYPAETIWGTQMYMISRTYARWLINTYSNGPNNYNNLPFSADWTITQNGNKRIIYPLIAIEDGLSTYDHYGQSEFHKAAHIIHLYEANYI